MEVIFYYGGGGKVLVVEVKMVGSDTTLTTRNSTIARKNYHTITSAFVIRFY